MQKPPVIEPPVKKRGRSCLLFVLLTVAAPILAFVLLVFLTLPRPPKEKDLLQNFYRNRAAFEQLRDMLQADNNLRGVADWGVDTRKPFFIGHPSAAIMPTERYRRYVALLQQVGGLVAFRSEGEPADPGVCVWGWGWGSHTRHINISWMDEAPTNQVTSLDDCRAPHRYGDRQYFYRHIDEHWYLDTDMRPPQRNH